MILQEGRGLLGLGALQEKVQGIPPAFLKPLTKRRVFEGDTLRFNAEVFGLPSPDVKWFRNKTQLVPDNRTTIERDGDNISLEIRNLSKADQGEYICEAVNYVGEAKSVALVVVISQEARMIPAPPAVTHQHVIEFDVEEDEDSSRSPSPQEILLEVELDENEVKEFEKQVKIVTIPEYTADNKSMIISLDVLPSMYEEGAVDFITQESEDLKIAFEVTEMPPRFINPICDIETPESTSVVFECSLMGIPSPVVSWFKGNMKIPHDKKKYFHSSDDEYSLIITEVKKEYEGEYSCTASNKFGQTTCTTTLKVQVSDVPPIIPVQCAEGCEAKFQYKVIGTPHPQVQWFKGNQEIKPSLNCCVVTDPDVSSEKNKHYLEISQLQQSDQGTYLCKASNSVGTATCSNEIRVIDKPSFVKTFESTSLAVGNPLRLECQVNEDTGVTVTWTRDGKKLHNTMDSKISFEEKVACLEIPKAKIKDTGTYACTAANDAGISMNVTVLDVPAAPIGPVNIIEVTPDSMVIDWRPPKDDGGSPVTNYIVEKRESNKETWGGVSSGSTATRLKISRLQSGVEYVVRIRAENKMGIGAPLESAPTVAKHQFEAPGHPGKPVASDIAEDALTLGWTMPLYDGGSPISGYIIERRHKGGKWIRVNKTPCKDLRFRVLGLFEGNDYEFRVFAENIAGFSGPSPVSDPAKPCRPITVPGPPVNPKVKDYSCTYADLVWIKPTRDGGKPPGPPGSLKVVDSTKTSITLGWARPVYDGGAPIIGYLVETRDKIEMEGEQVRDPEEGWTKCNTSQLVLTEFSMINLDERKQYEFRVSAQNQVGWGRPANLKDAVSPREIHGKTFSQISNSKLINI
uniref:Titin n=1 Tax=Astyanax mexicanus TaxID=7994 RepID=A0A8B9LRX8_ASTMX